HPTPRRRYASRRTLRLVVLLLLTGTIYRIIHHNHLNALKVKERQAAQSDEHARQWAAAIEHYNHLLDSDPNDPDSRARRAQAYERLGEWNAALADFDRLVKVRPQDRDIWLGLARADWALGHYDKSVQSYTKTLAIAPHDTIALNERGMIHAARARWKDAAADLVEAARLEIDNPADAKTGEERGWTTAQLCFRAAAMQLATGDQAGYRRLCVTLFAHLDQIEAAGAARGPGSPASNQSRRASVLGDAALTFVLAPGALPDYTRLLRSLSGLVASDPRNSVNRILYGAALCRARQYAAAIAELDEGSRLSGTTGTILDRPFLALAHRGLGHSRKAARYAADTARLEAQIRRAQANASPPLALEVDVACQVLAREVGPLSLDEANVLARDTGRPPSR
ncbi:MAG TPA: tetratricopeptide repeat protein, partial [Chloroflexota bacterium]|nr:tetratricopeptide repeat protein [Chloroflexota bacterium]